MSTRAIQEPPQLGWEQSVIDRVLAGEPSIPKPWVHRSGRQQHRSCDQCRKGKKGCDAVILRDGGANISTESRKGSGRVPLGPCSNCVKTGKKCTFVWFYSQGRNRMRQASNGPSQPSSKHMRLRQEDSGLSDYSSIDSLQQSQSTRRTSALHGDFEDIFERESVFASPESLPGPSTSQNWTNRTASFVEEFNKQSAPIPNFVQRKSPNTASVRYDATSATGYPHVKEVQIGTSRQRRRSRQPSIDISPFSIPETLVTVTNKTLMTQNLMKVYHDSMENALSCWLTERTCPYGVRVETSDGASLIDSTMLREWGPDWSNRICRQVIDLDHNFAAIRDKPLTRLEDKAASKALNLGIMAFATQWSQSSERSRAKFQPVSDETHSPGYTSYRVDHDPLPPVTEFDRLIQETIWSQARCAIQDATQIESFRVVFAHIVFALTQKPLEVGQHFPSVRPTPRNASSRNPHTTLTPESEDESEQREFSSEGTIREGHSRMISAIEDIIDQDGAPVFLEQGLRHIHTLRHKVDAVSTQLTQQDRKTVDLLYWLGVMFDTLSAAIHKRPLVVSDEDSDIRLEDQPCPKLSQQHGRDESRIPLAYQKHVPHRLQSTKSSTLWSSFFFQEQALRNRTPPIHWPCSYHSAATALADAAPIKVLLFRKVTRIQTLISRHIQGQQLEDAIKDALEVHQYWDEMYGPFILDCVAHHDQLPARIQSWYICLTGHWYLAVLLLADIIDFIDTERRISLKHHRSWRDSCGLVTALRRRASCAVADLARCACPREDASFHDASEFHFALNQGALLTEPWTQVLIRVFTKAGALLLTDSCTKDSSSEAEQPDKRTLERIESCVEALWYLGRKSDMAVLAARVLAEALQDVNGKAASIGEAQSSEDWLDYEKSLEREFSSAATSAGTGDLIGQMYEDIDFGLMDDSMMQDIESGLVGVDDLASLI